MSLSERRAAVAALACVVLAPRLARADDGDVRFFAEDVPKAGAPRETLIDGSLTSTSFYYQETSGLGTPIIEGNTQTRVASPVARLFTDVRAQLSARQIAGGAFAVRGDVRARFAATGNNPDGDVGTQNTGRALPTQSGAFGGNELEVRELYVARDGKDVDVYVGRKFQLELAATKFDGVEVQSRGSARWTTLGFAGLYPTRGSRDIHDDYKKGLEDPSKPATSGKKRILPITGGLGQAYRFPSAWGSFGAVAIAPLARDASGKIETPRVFATGQGYWRATQKLDVFHYMVVDAMGAAGAGLSNLTLGVGFQPRRSVRLSAQATEVDTETLNVQAQTRLDDRDPNAVNGVIQNNVEVSRVAQQSARAGLSVALAQERFEVSTSGTLRRRGALSIPTGPDGDVRVEFAAAKAVDVVLAFVDRRSWKQMRIGGSVVRTFGVGVADLGRSSSWTARLDASREIAEGRGEVEGSLSYLTASEDNIGKQCSIADIETCYGASKVASINLGGLAYYRFARSWFGVGSATVGRQSITSTYDMGPLAQPAILTAAIFLRLAYRF